MLFNPGTQWERNINQRAYVCLGHSVKQPSDDSLNVYIAFCIPMTILPSRYYQTTSSKENSFRDQQTQFCICQDSVSCMRLKPIPNILSEKGKSPVYTTKMLRGRSGLKYDWIQVLTWQLQDSAFLSILQKDGLGGSIMAISSHHIFRVQQTQHKESVFPKALVEVACSFLSQALGPGT